MSSCGSSKKVEKSPIKTFVMPCSQLVSSDGVLRAWAVGKSDNENTARKKAQTEAAAAGALHVQLAGDAWYFGELHKKPFIGDDLRPIEPEDITRVNRMMYAAAVLALVVFGGLKLALLLLI